MLTGQGTDEIALDSGHCVTGAFTTGIGAELVAGDRRAFDGVPQTGLSLLGVRSWAGSDNVVLSYAVDRD